MKEFIQNLYSPGWWLGIVVVSLVLNVTAAFIKDRIDRTIGRISNTWSTRTATKKAEREAFISSLINNPSEQIYYSIRSVHTFLVGLFYLILGFNLLILLIVLHMNIIFDYLYAIMGFFCFFICIYGFSHIIESSLSIVAICEARLRKLPNLQPTHDNPNI